MIFPFYEKARALFIKTQDAQIRKGLAKYPEPFNPHSWTPEELLNHALEESVDLVHYLVGLKDLIDAKNHEIKRLNEVIERYRTQEYFQPTKAPKYFDSDDQHI